MKPIKQPKPEMKFMNIQDKNDELKIYQNEFKLDFLNYMKPPTVVSKDLSWDDYRRNIFM